MKKELYIQIPEPCHEDWNKMTPVQQGRYCQSCCKEVVDFSLMTDQEIMSFLSKPRGKTCGNFSTDQLNRVIKEPTTPAKKRVWAVMLSFLLPLFVSIKGKTQTMGKPVVCVSSEKKPLKGKVAIKGDTILSINTTEFEVHGTVTDTSGNPIEGATILIKGTHNGAAANSKGEFRLLITESNRAVLQISSIGFETKEITVTETSNQKITLIPSSNELTGVVVVSSFSSRRGGYTVGMLRCTSEGVRSSIPIIDTIKNLIKPSLIKVYPNPASKASFVNVQLTNTGEYKLNLVDNQGKLIRQSSFVISAKRQAYQLELPSTIAAGIYYINVTDEKSKKQYTQKLIVQ